MAFIKKVEVPKIENTAAPAEKGFKRTDSATPAKGFVPVTQKYQSIFTKPVSATDNWYAGDKPTEKEALGRWWYMNQVDQAAATGFLGTLRQLQSQPGSDYWAPYRTATNQAVQNFEAMGVDTTGIENDEWFTDNAWMQQYMKLSDATNKALKPGKNASAEEMLGYNYNQAYEAKKDTANAIGEVDAIQAEIAWMVNDPGRNWTDDEIAQRIYDEIDGTNKNRSSKYPTLKKMEDGQKAGEPIRLNTKIDFSRDGVYGMIWAARNPNPDGTYGTVNWELNTALYAYGEGNRYKEDPYIRKRLDATNPETYSPYELGSTAEDLCLYFGVYELTPEWRDANRAKVMASGDQTKIDRFNDACDVIAYSEKLDGENAAMHKDIDRMVRAGYSADDIMKRLYKNDDYKDLFDLDDTMNDTTGKITELKPTAWAIDYKKEKIRKEIERKTGEAEDKFYLTTSAAISEGAAALVKQHNANRKKVAPLVDSHTTDAEKAAFQGGYTGSDAIARMIETNRLFADRVGEVRTAIGEQQLRGVTRTLYDNADRVAEGEALHRDYETLQKKTDDDRKTAATMLNFMAESYGMFFGTGEKDSKAQIAETLNRYGNAAAMAAAVAGDANGHQELDEHFGENTHPRDAAAVYADRVHDGVLNFYNGNLPEDELADIYYDYIALKDIVETGAIRSEHLNREYSEEDEAAAKQVLWMLTSELVNRDTEGALNKPNNSAFGHLADISGYMAMQDQIESDIQQATGMEAGIAEYDKWYNDLSEKAELASALYESGGKQYDIYKLDAALEVQRMAATASPHQWASRSYYDMLRNEEVEKSNGDTEKLVAGHNQIREKAKKDAAALPKEIDRVREVYDELKKQGVAFTEAQEQNIADNIHEMEITARDAYYCSLGKDEAEFNQTANAAWDAAKNGEYGDLAKLIAEDSQKSSIKTGILDLAYGLAGGSRIGLERYYGFLGENAPDIALTLQAFSPDEKLRYFYLTATQGEEAATEYLKFLLDPHDGVIPPRKSEQVVELGKEFTRQGFLESVIGTVASLGANVVAGPAKFFHRMKQSINGEDIETHSFAYLIEDFEQALREGSKDRLKEKYGSEELIDLLYDSFVSGALDSTMMGAVTGLGFSLVSDIASSFAKVGTFLDKYAQWEGKLATFVKGGAKIAREFAFAVPMGISAAESSYRETYMRTGGNKDLADKMAKVTFCAETVSEAFTFSNMHGMFKAGEEASYKGFRDFFVSFIKDTAEEVIGESANELVEAEADRILLGEYSNWEANVNHFQELYHCSREEAERLADEEMWKNVVKAGLSAVISAGATETGSYAAGSVSRGIGKAEFGNAIIQEGPATVMRLYQLAQQTEEGSKARSFAEAVDARYNEKNKFGKKNVGNLAIELLTSEDENIRHEAERVLGLSEEEAQRTVREAVSTPEVAAEEEDEQDTPAAQAASMPYGTHLNTAEEQQTQNWRDQRMNDMALLLQAEEDTTNTGSAVTDIAIVLAGNVTATNLKPAVALAAAQGVMSMTGGDAKAAAVAVRGLLQNSGSKTELVKEAIAWAAMADGGQASRALASVVQRAKEGAALDVADALAVVNGMLDDQRGPNAVDLQGRYSSAVQMSRKAGEIANRVNNGELEAVTKAQQQALERAEQATQAAGKVARKTADEAKAAAKNLEAANAEYDPSPDRMETAATLEQAANRVAGAVNQATQAEQGLKNAQEKEEAARNELDDSAEDAMNGFRAEAETAVAQQEQAEAEAEEQQRIADEAAVQEAAAQQEAAEESAAREQAAIDSFVEQNYPGTSKANVGKITDWFIKRDAARAEGREATPEKLTAERAIQNKNWIENVAKRFGYTDVRYENTRDKNGRITRPARIDMKTGTVILDETASMTDFVKQLLPHELMHGAEKSETYDELADTLIKARYGDDSERLKKDIALRIDHYLKETTALNKENPTIAVQHLTPKQAQQEIVADIIGDLIYGNEDLARRLATQSPTVFRRVVDAIKGFIAKIKGNGEDFALTRQLQGVVDMYEREVSRARWNQMKETGVEPATKYSFNENIELGADVKPVAVDSKGNLEAVELPGGTISLTDDVKYSLNSFNDDEQKKVRDALINSGRFTEAQIDRYMGDALGIASVIAADKTRLDFEANDNQVFLKPNNDYYFTLDASTLCAKRLLYQGTFDYVQHALPNEVFTPEDLIDLVNIMNDMGYETPCGICYVESRRRWLDTYAQKFLDELPEDADGLIEKYFKKASDEEKAAIRENYTGEKPSIDDLTTSDGLEKLRHEIPYMHKAFVAAMNKKGTANPKVVQLRTEYRGDIRNLTAKDIQKVKDIGGLRIQSFSDFETPHLLDMMQAVLDMSAAGLTSQAYTKVPNFAWVFGDTGIKINLSLIGKGTGLDENGNLIFDNREGINFDEAMKLRERYGENVGTILVGINDDHIVAAMGDPRIDFIIPFHKSGWSAEELRKMPTLNNYNDYTDTQNERLIIGRKADGSYETESFKVHKDRTKESLENFQPVGKSGYWNFKESGQWNAEKYLKMCAEQKRVPKFSQFLVDNGDGSFSLPQGTDKRSTAIREGYWKTLIDFKMYENDSYGRTKEDGTRTEVKGAEQKEVTPNINMNQAYRVMDDYKLGRQMPDREDGTPGRFIPMENNNSVPVAIPAADEYIELIKRKREGVKPEGPNPDALEADLPEEMRMSDRERENLINQKIDNGEDITPEEEAFLESRNPRAPRAEAPVMDFQPTEGTEEPAQKQKARYVDENGEVQVKNSFTLNDEINRALGVKPEDAPYMAAVERGEMDEAQRMVDEAAKKAGYVLKGYHGTKQPTLRYDALGYGNETDYENKRLPFTVFKAGQSGGIYIATNRDVSEGFAKNFSGDPGTVMSLYVRFQNPLVVNEYVYDSVPRYYNIPTPTIMKEAGYTQETVGTEEISIFAQERGYDGVIIEGIREGADTQTDDYIAFRPDQIKLADPVTYDDQGNVIPLSERFNDQKEDIRYNLLPSDSALQQQIDDFLNDFYGDNPSEAKTPEGPQRQWGSDRAQNSDELDAATKRWLYEHSDYTQDRNRAQIDRAVAWIREGRNENDPDGFQTALQAVTDKEFNSQTPDGQARLLATLAMAVARRDRTAQIMIADAYNASGTLAGQTLQARKIFRMMTPEGRIATIQKMLRDEQSRLKERGIDMELTFSDWIYRLAEIADGERDFAAVRKEAAKELAAQIVPNWKEKMRSIRMLSMLANPRTHIRNIVGNMLFVPAVSIKNKLGAMGESIFRVEQGQRTKTLNPFLDKSIRNFANEIAKREKDNLTGEAKYDDSTLVDREVKKFRGFLNTLSDMNSRALEGEDWFFLKGHFRRAFGGWMQANGYTVDQVRDDAQLMEQGIEYAKNEAQKATYRDFNEIASRLSNLSRNAKTPGGKALGFLVDAALPFKKTPANILKRGIEYSPVGLVKSMTYDLLALKKFQNAQKNGTKAPAWAKSPTQVIDDFCSGLSGTAIMAMGMLFAHLGAASAGFDDDDKFRELRGEQEYAINPVKFANEIFGVKLLGEDVTYTVDWAAPMSMPFFVGVALMNQIEGGGIDNIDEVLNAVGRIAEPVFNLSMLDGVNIIFKTAQYDDTNEISQILLKLGTNYISSYWPSAFGSDSRTVDPFRRKAFVPQDQSKGPMGTLRYSIEQLQNKVPGWSQENIPVRDMWGNPMGDPMGERFIENFLSPGYIQRQKSDAVLDELERVYKLTGSGSLIPKDPGKTIELGPKVTNNPRTIILTDQEWDTYKTVRGQTAFETLQDLMTSDYYQIAGEETQAKMVSDVWSYATQEGKRAVAPDYTPEKDYTKGGKTPVQTIIDDTRESLMEKRTEKLNAELLKSLRAGDMEGFDAMVEALRDNDVPDSSIKETISKEYRDAYKAAYLQNTPEGDAKMLEIENKLDMIDEFDFDYRSWQKDADKKQKEKEDKEGGGNSSSSRGVIIASNGIMRLPQLAREGTNDPTGQFGKGNIDLNNRQLVMNPDGSFSTELSFSFYDEDTGKEVLIPTVINGQIVSDDEAIEHYYQTGEYLGMFDTPEEADRYAEMLHRRQEWYYNL